MNGVEQIPEAGLPCNKEDPVFRRYGPWVVTTKFDPDCARLADRHYSRQTVGARQFLRPGRNLLLRTRQGDAVWATYASRFRKDGYDAWENTLFRNESFYLSSDLVRWAIFATICEWGEPLPKDGLITYIREEAVRSRNPGCCYKDVGFAHAGYSKRRKHLRLQLNVDQRFLAIQEVLVTREMEASLQEMMVALHSGEHMDAVWFRREAQRKEDFLRKLRSAKARLKHAKRDCFEPVMSLEDLLVELSPDGWIPVDMLTVEEDLWG